MNVCSSSPVKGFSTSLTEAELFSIRQRAKRQLLKCPVSPPALTALDLPRLSNELLIRNVQFEIQNEELKLARARAESATRQLAEIDLHLEELVEDRTAALADAKIQAERANTAKSRFLAAVIHDLRQPLSAISVYVGSIETDRPPAPKLLSDLKACVASLSTMLTDLFDLSKLGAGVVTPNVSDFRLDALLDRVLSSQSPEAKAKGLLLRSRCPELTARSDAVLFQRILQNLVSNAIRYTDRGGVLVGCRRAKGKTWIEVWDTGIGIPVGNLGEIFEEFRQLEHVKRDRAKGSGLGLAIVAKAAGVLGLQIRAQSRVGAGSMFAIEVPVSTAETVERNHGLTDSRSLVAKGMVATPRLRRP